MPNVNRNQSNHEPTQEVSNVYNFLSLNKERVNTWVSKAPGLSMIVKDRVFSFSKNANPVYVSTIMMILGTYIITNSKLARDMESKDKKIEWLKEDKRKLKQNLEKEKGNTEQEKNRAEQEKNRAEQGKNKAEQEKNKAEQEKNKAEQEKNKAEQEKNKAEQEKMKMEKEMTMLKLMHDDNLKDLRKKFELKLEKQGKETAEIIKQLKNSKKADLRACRNETQAFKYAYENSLCFWRKAPELPDYYPYVSSNTDKKASEKTPASTPK